MMSRKFVPYVFREKKPAATVGPWPDSHEYYIPVTFDTLRVMYGVAQMALDKRFWEGTSEEIENALESLEQQLSEPPIHISELCQHWGASFRTLDAEQLEALQGVEHPAPPWEFEIVYDEEFEDHVLRFRTVEENG